MTQSDSREKRISEIAAKTGIIVLNIIDCVVIILQANLLPFIRLSSIWNNGKVDMGKFPVAMYLKSGKAADESLMNSTTIFITATCDVSVLKYMAPSRKVTVRWTTKITHLWMNWLSRITQCVSGSDDISSDMNKFVTQKLILQVVLSDDLIG